MVSPVPITAVTGSPPLARRARGGAGVGLGAVRLTSARAESTASADPHPSTRTAHLRSRGEHPGAIASAADPGGSPPLARRARPSHRPWTGRPRLTSARAESTRCPSAPAGSGSAHLRSRGEHVGVQFEGEEAGGSPPLARRALLDHLGRSYDLRLTSARAESTSPGTASRPPSSAHLRSRGEHQSGNGKQAAEFGSPPLARRARINALPNQSYGRLTSARAESTFGVGACVVSGAAHLRSRGEHEVCVTALEAVAGSPPLARRALARGGLEDAGGRLTSARAESTASVYFSSASAAAHLRSRGEHAVDGAARMPSVGSPPLARRAPAARRPQPVAGRLTSARAESTPVIKRRIRERAAHLRSRGEHTSEAQALLNTAGSPPLARRARGEHEGPDHALRLTSARAESTFWVWRSGTGTPAHLRSRGEHKLALVVPSPSLGSPPLARRAPQRAEVLMPRVRLTSARAESTP